MRALRLAVFAFFCCTSTTLIAQASPESPAVDAAPISPPQHPATAEQVRELLALNHSIDLAHEAMMQSLKAARMTSATYYTPGFWDDMEKAVLQIDIATPCISAYQRYFSEEDMAAAIQFYKSSAGQRLLAAQPAISETLKAVLRQAGEQAGRSVAEKHKDEIERLMKQQAPGQSPAINLQP